MQIFSCESFRFISDGIKFKFEILYGPADISVGHMQAKGLQHDCVTVDRGMCEDS